MCHDTSSIPHLLKEGQFRAKHSAITDAKSVFLSFPASLVLAFLFFLVFPLFFSFCPPPHIHILKINQASTLLHDQTEK